MINFNIYEYHNPNLHSFNLSDFFVFERTQLIDALHNPNFSSYAKLSFSSSENFDFSDDLLSLFPLLCLSEQFGEIRGIAQCDYERFIYYIEEKISLVSHDVSFCLSKDCFRLQECLQLAKILENFRENNIPAIIITQER